MGIDRYLALLAPEGDAPAASAPVPSPVDWFEPYGIFLWSRLGRGVQFQASWRFR